MKRRLLKQAWLERGGAGEQWEALQAALQACQALRPEFL